MSQAPGWRTYAALGGGVLIVSTASILVRFAQGQGVPSLAIAAWRLAIEAGLRFLGSPGAPPRLPLPSDAKLTSHGLYWLGREALLALHAPRLVELVRRSRGKTDFWLGGLGAGGDVRALTDAGVRVLPPGAELSELTPPSVTRSGGGGAPRCSSPGSARTRPIMTMRDMRPPRS